MVVHARILKLRYHEFCSLASNEIWQILINIRHLTNLGLVCIMWTQEIEIELQRSFCLSPHVITHTTRCHRKVSWCSVWSSKIKLRVGWNYTSEISQIRSLVSQHISGRFGRIFKSCLVRTIILHIIIHILASAYSINCHSNYRKYRLITLTSVN